MFRSNSIATRTCNCLFMTMTDSFSFSCKEKKTLVTFMSQSGILCKTKDKTYNVGDDSREQKVLLVFVGALLKT